MAFQIQIRRDTAANWTSVDPTMAQGEMGYETDTGQFKIGDGATAWTSLPYIYGEVNTASNVGTAGVGVFKQKTALDLEFKKLNAGSGKVTVTDDGVNSEVDIDVVPAQISHNDLGSIAGSSDGYHLSSTISGYVNNLTSDAQSQLNAKEPTLPLSTRGDVLVRDASNNTARLAVGAAGTVLSSDGTDVSWAVASGGASFDRVTIVTSTDDASSINTAIAALTSAGGGTLLVDGLIDLDGDITVSANVVLRGSGPGCGFKNTSASNYAINFVGTTPTWYAASPSTATVTTDTAADAGNFSQGDWVLMRDDAATNRATTFFVARSDGNASTGVIDTYQRTSILCSATCDIAKLDHFNGGMANLDLYTTSTGTLTVNMQYVVDCFVESCNFTEAKLNIDTSIDTRVNCCVFNIEDNTSWAIHLELNGWLNWCTISNCKFLSGSYGIEYTSANTAMASLYILNNTFTSLNAVYLNTSHASKRDYLNHLVISNNSFIGALNAAGGSGGVALTMRLVMRWWTISNNTCDNSYSNFLVTSTASGVVQYQGTLSGNAAYSSISITTMQLCSVTGNVFFGTAVFDYGILGGEISGNTFGALYIRDNDRYAVYDTRVIGNYINGSTILNGDATRYFERVVISGNVFRNTVTFTSHARDVMFTNNMFDGNVVITSSASEVADRIIFSNNNVDGTVTFTEANQDYCVITGNTTNGAITDLTAGGGTGNIQANNTEY